MNKFSAYCVATSILLAPLFTSAAHADDWFVPKSSQPKAAAAPKPVRHAAPPRAVAPAVAEDDNGDDMQNQAPPVLPLPTIPKPATLPKGNPPPQAVVGVISVPEVMRQSVAAQAAQKELVARRDALQNDVQKEQKAWRAEQQQIQAKAKTMTAEQIQSRERKLQARVLNAQKDFRNRSRIIQEAAQVAFGQIERELIQIIQNVAESRNMNLVLHREQVALSVNGLDITDEVAKNLNSNLPSVMIPKADEDPEQMATTGKWPTTANPEPVQQNQEKSVVTQSPAK